MTRIVLSRLLMIIPLLLFVSLLSFLLLELIPGSAADRFAGENATAEQVKEIEVQLGLDRPLPTRYFDWIGDAVRGDFGESIVRDTPVWKLFSQRLPATLSMNLLGLAIGIITGMATGLLSAVHAGRPIDRIITAVNTVLFAIPPFWLGLMLVSLFAVQLQWFDAIGYTPTTDGIWNWLRSITLPAVSLSVIVATNISRQLRAAMTDVLSSRYVQAARASGIPRRRIILRHALRNAMIPTVTVIGFMVALSIGFAFVVETAFAYPGFGSLIAGAVISQDFPVVQAGLFLTAVAVSITNLLVDLSYGWLDPKVRR